MIQQAKPSATVRAEILDALVDTGIKQLAPGAKARAFADIVGDRIGEMEARMFVNLADTLLPFATGDSLDLLGEIYGVSRLGRQDSVVLAGDNSFRFYVRTGTFGDINDGNNIVIPSDVRLFGAVNTGPIFLADSVTLPAASSEVFFGARSSTPGTEGNAPAGVIARHNFTGYTESRFGSLLVSNNVGIVGGRDPEKDDNYRFRIHLKILSRAGANEAALRFALLQVPGVQDIVFKREAGTFTVYVYAVSPSVPASLLARTQAQLNDVVAYPMSGLTVAPDLIGISLSTTVRFISGVSEDAKASILANAKSAAEDYINNLTVGETLVINEIADRIRNADSNILDIGEATTSFN